MEQLKEKMLKSLLVKFNQNMNSKLVAHFSRNDLHKATLALAQGETPSPNGIIVEFYVIFWHIIDDDFFKMLQIFITI
jgi:hypothetical protein